MHQKVDLRGRGKPRVHHSLLWHSHEGQELHLGHEQLALTPVLQALGLLLPPSAGGFGSCWNVESMFQRECQLVRKQGSPKL